MHIANGDTLNLKLADKGNRLTTLLSSGKAEKEVIEETYLICLSRLPTEKEAAGMHQVLTGAKSPEEKRLALEDVFWGLMSSREFLFNH